MGDSIIMSRKLKIKVYLSLALFSILLFITSCANSSTNSKNSLQTEAPLKTVSYKSKRLDKEIIKGMDYVRYGLLDFNNSDNLQVFLTELSANNKKISDESLEAVVTYGKKKKVKYFDYTEEDGTHFCTDKVAKKGKYMYKFNLFNEIDFRYEHFCTLNVYKTHGKKVKLIKSKKFDVSSLLKDNSDEFMVSITDVIDKNQIRVMYNSSYQDKNGIYNAYGGIAVFNIKTGNVKTKVKTDFFVSFNDAKYIYGGNSKGKGWGDDDKYYIADKKTGKVIHIIKSNLITNASGIKRFRNGTLYCITDDGQIISEGINTNAKCVGTIQDDKYFKKYMVQNLAVKNESEFYILYSTDWTNEKKKNLMEHRLIFLL